MAHEGAAIWLFRRLREAGALDALPAAAADRLRHQAFEASAIRLEVEGEAAAAIEVLDAARIPVVLIKGIARCALASRYRYLDARATDDVDLLVPRECIAEADRLLRSNGYQSALPDDAPLLLHHHLPPLRKGPITVELHASTSIHVPADVAWARATDHGEVLRWGGREVRVPSVTELAWSAIEHALEDEIGGLRLKRFLEVTALVSERAPVDWTTLVERSIADEGYAVALGVPIQQRFVLAWLDAAMALAAPASRPAGVPRSAFDLRALLAWRLMVLGARPRLGRAVAGRLLEEGPRALLGWPMQASPANASRVGRVRRRIAGRLGRLVFHGWAVCRGTPGVGILGSTSRR